MCTINATSSVASFLCDVPSIVQNKKKRAPAFAFRIAIISLSEKFKCCSSCSRDQCCGQHRVVRRDRHATSQKYKHLLHEGLNLSSDGRKFRRVLPTVAQAVGAKLLRYAKPLRPPCIFPGERSGPLGKGAGLDNFARIWAWRHASRFRRVFSGGMPRRNYAKESISSAMVYEPGKRMADNPTPSPPETSPGIDAIICYRSQIVRAALRLVDGFPRPRATSGNRREL
jgi:hypothetical protein